MSTSARYLPHALIAVLVITASVPAWISHGQEQPQPVLDVSSGVTTLPTQPVQPVASQVVPTQVLTFTLNLPLLERGPLVTPITFASAINESTGEPIDPNSAFPAGTTRLYTIATFIGATGRTWQLEVTFPDGGVLEGNGTIPGDEPHLITPYVCRTASGSCGFGEQPLELGTYTVKIFLDGYLFEEGSATIQ